MIWKMRTFTRGMIGWCAVWIALGLYTGFPGLAAAQGVDVPPVSVSTNDLWLIVYGTLVAIIVNALKQLPPHFTVWQKRGIAVAVSGALAVVTLYYAERLDMTNLRNTWLLVFVVATGIYGGILRPVTDMMAGNRQT